MTDTQPQLCPHCRAASLTDDELLAAWDGLRCDSTLGELAVGLRPLGLELLAADEAGNIVELREQHEAVWEEIVGRGLVHLTPPDTRYPLDGDAEAETVARGGDPVPVA